LPPILPDLQRTFWFYFWHGQPYFRRGIYERRPLLSVCHGDPSYVKFVYHKAGMTEARCKEIVEMYMEHCGLDL
jgi:hypothetical protein